MSWTQGVVTTGVTVTDIMARVYYNKLTDNNKNMLNKANTVNKLNSASAK